jgi:hypothetical protein
MTLLAISTPFILFLSAAGVVQAMLLASIWFFHPKADRTVTRFLSLHILTVSIFMLIARITIFLFLAKHHSAYSFSIPDRPGALPIRQKL